MPTKHLQLLQLGELKKLQENQMTAIHIREARLEDLDRCYEIESLSYEGDEAATKEKIEKRIVTYPDGFVVLEVDNIIAGFINCGATHTVELSDESFKELVGHAPDGKHIVIMSVVVHPQYQGQGLAGKLLQSFIEKMTKLGKSEIFLICQKSLIPMYAKYGFNYIAPSDSDHGGMSWHEMSMQLKSS